MRCHNHVQKMFVGSVSNTLHEQIYIFHGKLCSYRKWVLLVWFDEPESLRRY